MIIGIPKEIKNNEFRVGLIPASVAELINNGHSIFVEKDAGIGIGSSDQDYIDVGAKILDTPAEIFDIAEMIIKVKEPQANEYEMLRRDQILFTYLHLAPDLKQTMGLIRSGAICIAYETVTDKHGGLPLLVPMSEVAGRMAIQAGSMAMQKSNGGAGLLLSGVPGVEPASVVIIGGGVVGFNAAKIAIGMGANVTILDKNITTLNKIDDLFFGKVNTIYSTNSSIEHYVKSADLLIGAVLVFGSSAPKLVTKKLVKKMKEGAVIVDVAIDQGGCCETSHATTHEEPIYIVDKVVHYCVANMPGAVARTSALALNNATLPYVMKIADLGYKEALKNDPYLLNGLNICHGNVTILEVAKSHNLLYVEPLTLL